MIKMKCVVILLFSVLSSNIAFANTIYIGAGAASMASTTEAGAMPFAIGYIGFSEEGTAFGIDFAAEGTALDSTYGRSDTPVQSYSLNFVLGKALKHEASNTLAAGVLVGFRNIRQYCPRSYIGYRCYADQDPHYEYDLNLGGIITYRFNTLVIGARATQASTQLLMGVSY